MNHQSSIEDQAQMQMAQDAALFFLNRVFQRSASEVGDGDTSLRIYTKV